MSGAYQPAGTVTVAPFTDKTGLRYMPDSVMGEFDNSPDGEYFESSIDYLVASDCFVSGIGISLKFHEWGDFLYMKVIHPLYGEVARFGKEFRPCPEISLQPSLRSGYQAELLTGLILRFCYNTKKTGTEKIKAIINIEIHEKVV